MPVMRPEMLALGPVPEAAAPEGPRAGTAEAFRQALLEGASVRAQTQVLRQYLEGGSVAWLVDHVLAPALRSVGALWECRDDGIFLEHRAVTICEQVLEALRRLLAPAQDSAPRAVGGGPEDDPYNLPSNLAATVLQAEGWRTTNLGAFTPGEVLVQAAVRERAELVWLAVGAARETGAIPALVAGLVAELDGVGWPVPVVVGGPSCDVRPGALPRGGYLISNMAELSAFARGLCGAESTIQ